MNPISDRRAALAAIATLAAFSNARAEAQYCTGLITEHLVYSDGTLMILAPWRNDWINLCNLQSPWKGVSTEACFSWFSLVTAARTNNEPIDVYYDSNLTCATFGTYGGAPGAVYVRMGPG